MKSKDDKNDDDNYGYKYKIINDKNEVFIT